MSSFGGCHHLPCREWRSESTCRIWRLAFREDIVCIVGNAARVAGIIASFRCRSQCEDVSGTQVSSVRASSEASDAGEMVTPYKVSVFQKICWQALNVLIPSQTFSACFIFSSAGRTFHSFEDSTLIFGLHTQHEVYRTYSFGTGCLSHRLCR